MDNRQHHPKRQKDLTHVLLIVAIMVLGIFLGFRLGKVSNRSELTIPSGGNKLDVILEYAKNNYVDDISVDSIVENIIPQMLKNLDPHSIYIPASDMREASEDLQGNFGGIGISFNMPEDTVVVMSVINGGPSQRVGIEAGDRLMRINDTLVAGEKVPQDGIMKRLRGEVGTEVKVEVFRPSLDQNITFNITRDLIPKKSVDVAYMVTKNIGYVKMSKFTRTTHAEFVEAVTKLHSEGMEKLIVDLRNNTGGYLDQAFEITNEFLPKGELVVYTEGLHRRRQNYYSNGRGLCVDNEVVVLINEGSASASEILAGAIQDNDRGTIVGQRSYGKGLVQEQIPFRDGSGLLLTIARYYTPTGRCIQKPYTSDTDEYFMDRYRRYERGEMESADSAYINDSLRYITPGGKVVYGGGGIMPDEFVPIDTIDTKNEFLRNLFAKNLIYKYSLSFTDAHRKQLLELETPHEVDKFFATKPNLLPDFVSFVAKSGLHAKGNEWASCKALVETLLKAYIARNTQLDDLGYHHYMDAEDSAVQKAVEVLQAE